MSNSMRARRTILPVLTLTVATETPEPGAERIELNGRSGIFNYYRKPVRPIGQKRQDDGPEWASGRYSRFPIVLNKAGVPWTEANLYLIDCAEIRTEPNMLTLGSIAEDLAAYHQFIDEEDLDWLAFGVRKYARPTYRYSGYLKNQIRASKVSPSVAKRRMATVVRFYGWLIKNKVIHLEHEPWIERGVSLVFKDEHGAQHLKQLTTTDISIRVVKAKDPFDDHINDGGRLRPLPMTQQRAVLEALHELGNTEITLAHHLSLFTGAREQTVLTLRLGHFRISPEEIQGTDIRLKCGPGTGIDTKRNKAGVLHIPKHLYARLYTYANSERARKRQMKSDKGHADGQYLFLTQKGQPFYESIEDRHDLRLKRRLVKSTKQGQALRAYIKSQVIPLASTKLGDRGFHYKFHDLRASFGMNYVDFWIGKSGTDPKAREKCLKQLSALMWHSNIETTLGYLNYRDNIRVFEAADDGWHNYLKKLVEKGLALES